MAKSIWSLIFVCLLFSNLQSQIVEDQRKLLSGSYLKFIEKGDIENIQLRDHQSNDERLKASLIISEDYLRKGFYKESAKYVFQAERLTELSNAESLQAFAHIIIASFYRKLELNQKAKESLEKGIKPMSLIKDESEKLYVEGRFQMEKGLLDLALSKKDKGLSELWKSKSKFRFLEEGELKDYVIQLINSELGEYYLNDASEIDSSYYYFRQNLKAEDYSYFPVLARNGIIRYYLLKKQSANISGLVSKTTADLSDMKSIRLKRDIYNTLSQIYYEERDAENYKKYNQDYLRLSDSIYEIDKETRILVLQHLDHDASLKDKGKSNFLFWILIILAIAVLALGVTYNYHLKVKKEYTRFLEIMDELESKEKNAVLNEESNVGGPYLISEKTEQTILDKLKKFEESDKYLNPKMSLQMLARLLETNTKYLSEIVNKNKGQNFNHYINELRINYILKKIKAEPKYRNYKVSSLAEECGFGSRNTFTTAFKNFTGMSPATFIGFMKKENSHNKR